MARPNVTFKLNDLSVIGPAAEGTIEQPSFKMTAAMISDGDELIALARSGEALQGYMTIPNSNDLYARLNQMIVNFAGGETFLCHRRLCLDRDGLPRGIRLRAHEVG